MSECKSAEIVGSIDDLLTQVLLCLPVRSLIRLKSVSKQWFSLITNPKFCNLRSQKINPAIGTYFCTSHSKPRYEYIPFSLQKPINAPSMNLDFNARSFIFQSCNGLLLLLRYRIMGSCTFYVYNPTTNKKTDIAEFRSWFPSGTTLAFDPVKSPYYKLVFVQLLDKAYQIQIYSSETRDWRICGEIGRDGGNVDFPNGVYWNGSIHWVSLRRDSRNSLRFHVETQVLEEMPTPPYENFSYRGRACYFGESCDHLNYIELGPQFNVYEMKRDYSEWFVKYSVDLSPVIAAHPDVIGRIDRLCYYFSILSLVHGEKEEEDSILFFLIQGKVIKYNIAGGNFEKLCEFEGDNVSLNVKGFKYIESLSCV